MKVIAVVVAWNRAELLKETLQALANQSAELFSVVAVNNASTDHTAQVLQDSPVSINVVELPHNYGGAGGFTAGIARALTLGAEYIWLMDDDTVPSPTALEELLKVQSELKTPAPVLASRANWVDGREHPMNTPRTKGVFGKQAKIKHSQLREIRSASFVSVLLDAKVIKQRGLPVADYFLWNDDFEYTARLIRGRTGYYVSSSQVEHRTKTFGNSTFNPGERFYNEVRNKIWCFTRSNALNPIEKILYGGKTLLRWLRYLLTAESKKRAFELLIKGIKDAKAAPRANAVVLAGTEIVTEIQSFEA